MFIALMAAVVGVISCTKEIENPQDKPVPSSKYLVIKADCAQTKTDINEGLSTWEKDDVIEVVYKDNVYEYVASSDGAVVCFVSENGIVNYDGSALTAYYNAIDAAEGIVGVEAEATIGWQAETQNNSACAPLVGTPVSDEVEDGALRIRFDNIFSTLELRIDPAGKPSPSPIKSLTLEPAEGSEFEGCLAFRGTVDPSTLALAAAENGTGNTLVRTLPAETDATQAQTLKIPVGRFSSSAGLKLTLTLEDGTAYERNVWQSGLTTYQEAEGKFSAKHIARALYNFVPSHFSGGRGTEADPYLIGSVDDLNTLSTYVASMDEEYLPFRTAYYEQIANIDFDGATFSSIGNTNATAPYSFFCGKYDGKGYKIENIVIANVNSNKAQGFFGYLDGAAHIKNMNFDKVTINASTWNVGTIAGCVQNTSTALIENCHVTNGSVYSSGDAVGGIVGKMQVGTVRGCSYSGTVSAGNVNVGGVTGLMDNYSGSFVTECSVEGTVSGTKDQVGGIAGKILKGGITSCTVAATVKGTNLVGGVAGYVAGGTVKTCTLTNPSVSGTKNIGGVAGQIDPAGTVTGCSVTGGTVNGTAASVGGIVGVYNKGGLISQCNTSGVAVETAASNAGGILGDMWSGTDAKTSKVENCNVSGGSVTSTSSGQVGGVIGCATGKGIVNKCSASCNVANTGGSGGRVGGIAGFVNTTDVLIANCIYYGGELTNNNSAGGVGGIAGQFSATSLSNTAIVNCASFPTKVSTSGGANIAGIAGFAQTITIRNCYCPAPSSAFLSEGASTASSRGSVYGWLRGVSGETGSSGTIVNAYWLDGFKAGASSGSYTYTKKEQSLSDEQMKNTGAVSMPSTGTAYPCFLDALNAGADEYNTAMIFDVRAEEWVMGTNGYPVIYGCPIASSTATSTKTRVSLIGDSITTYQGYTLFPSNYQYPKSSYTDFTSVTQTYWYQLIYEKMTNALLEANSSHTATCVQNTTKNGYPGYGFLNRYADLGNPDVIFINGGTNDSWSFNLPVGTLDFTIATDDLDTYQFAQAYDKLIRLLEGKYPDAKIFCIIGDCVMDSQYSAYAQVIRDVCNHYNIHYAEVVFADRSASTYDSVHPNVAGMKEMADQIWEQVKSYL